MINGYDFPLHRHPLQSPPPSATDSDEVWRKWLYARCKSLYRDSLRNSNRWGVPDICQALFDTYEHAMSIQATHYIKYHPIDEIKHIVTERFYRLASMVRDGITSDVRIIWVR